MLRAIFFFEVELVRVEDGVPAGPARRLDASVRPMTYALAAVLAGAAAGLSPLAYAYLTPLGEGWESRNAVYCRFGPPGPHDASPRRSGCCFYNPEPGPVTAQDSTRFVRRLR